MDKVKRTDAEWRELLTPEEYAILRQAGTEAPFTGEYTDTKTVGVYRCRACGAELFRSDARFESHCGWRRSTSRPIRTRWCSSKTACSA